MSDNILHFGNACLPAGYQDSLFVDFLSPEINNNNSPFSGDFNIFDFIDPLLLQPNPPLPVVDYGRNAYLQSSSGPQWSPGQPLQPAVNPLGIYYAEDGRSLPPRPRTGPQTPQTSSEKKARPVHPRQRFPVGARIFKKSNDLKRHAATVHGEDNESKKLYRCSCGHATARKDNYRRHHTGDKGQRPSCAKVAELVSPGQPFVCYCGAVDCSASAHLQHVTGCSAARHGPSGRPRRSS
ncbi:uncharacterized protein PG986_009655 [Apiospora aurea]|uniref:C2H2-type domain-containing protein n=1 Tax=Apiospora aurea TaxID=335848 RepID=A0ABR1Q8B0_9PEZI